MSKAVDRFLKYVSFDTQSDGTSETTPSTAKQLKLGRYLYEELKSLGASDVKMDDNGYVYAVIPANTDAKLCIGFLSHMDTALEVSGANIHPRLIPDYDGKAITLDKEGKYILDPQDSPGLLDHIGETLIVTDGTTLLGADDKAGVAAIMSMAAYFLEHPEVKHGKIAIAFTPDEEIGRGVDKFDYQQFGADAAYTVDGGALGDLSYETFNAAAAKIIVSGSSYHPGSSKGKMINASLVAMEFNALLPEFQKPCYTEKYEGFYHLNSIRGNVDTCTASYIIRDHSTELFEEKKKLFADAAAFINRKYGREVIRTEINDSYYNMERMIRPHMELVEYASEAMKEVGITPDIEPIRGGTDGSALSFHGVPCPNVCTGGYNFHGRYEFIAAESIDKNVEFLIHLAQKFV